MGHLSGMTMAVGFDHLIYGWVFFGLVISLLFLIGSLWREDRRQPVLDAAARARAAATAATPSAAPARLALAALAVLLAAGAGPLAAGYLERAQFNPQPVRLDGFQAAWPATAPFADWQPAFAAPAAQLRQSYAAGQQQVGLTLLYYRNQQPERPMISSGNRLTLDAKNQAWHEAGSALRQESLQGQALTVNETVLKGANGRLLVWRWYAIDGRRTANDYVGKLWALRQRLLRGSDDGAVLLLSTPLDEQPETARAALRRFVAANLAPLEATLAANGKP
jgi:EpsI family protein